MVNTKFGKWKPEEGDVQGQSAGGDRPRMRIGRLSRVLAGVAAASVLTLPAPAQQLSLVALVTPSTVISKDGRPVVFAIHGFVELESLADLFLYIDKQEQRWKGRLDDGARQHLGDELLRRGIESRVISMVDERPLETLITHTREE